MSKRGGSAAAGVWLLLVFALFGGRTGAQTRVGGGGPLVEGALRVRAFQPADPLCRARRPAVITAIVENRAETPARITARLALPAGVRLVRGDGSGGPMSIEDAGERTLSWTVEARAPGVYPLRLEIAGNGAKTSAALSLRFLPAVAAQKLPYVPVPQPARTDILVGAHNCPLWESDKPFMWANVLKHPERTPALGFYGQEDPEVADWETKWAVEHGVSFFIYCWYRNGQGGPVRQNFGSAIHQALFRSRYAKKLKFTIMWENQSRGMAGVSDERDLMENLLPFWIDTYFKRPEYLKVDNRPVLFIYRPEFLVDDLGGVERVRAAFDKMRRKCVEAGFDGLTILGEYRELDPEHLRLMGQLGLDYTFAYCWYVPGNPTPEQSIRAQMQYIRKTQELGILPQVATVSQAWSGWADEGTIWKIPPPQFETLLRQARDFIQTLPAGQLGRRMLLLDNWNEWGEGHYIAPYREYGFGYLDAVRRVFSSAPEAHTDLIPQDVGRGPYDRAFRAQAGRDAELRRLGSRKVRRPGGDETGLVGWWSFDETPASPVAQDDSGHRLGAVIRKARRAPGIAGSALVCDGGCAVVGSSPLLSPSTALSIECWVKTDHAGQSNNWLVNRVLAGGTATGYRLGLLDDRPCFEVPLTDWSHHLTAAEPLPRGRWVHLAGTFDGRTMRLYVDGQERARMERAAPVHPNDFHLCLGSYEEGHPAHFTGLLDEVRLYARALSPEEVAAHYRRYADRANGAVR